MTTFSIRILLFVFFLLLIFETSAKEVNRTIDDTQGDSQTGVKPYYFPETGFWDGTNCTRCSITPDVKQAQNGTWMGATYRHGEGSSISITLPFTGTAIYVYFILANDQGSAVTTTTAANFTLDGQLVGNFVHNPTGGKSALDYNVLAHSSVGLDNTFHQLVISTWGLDHDVWVGFDYALYTFDDELPATTLPSIGRPVNGTIDDTFGDSWSEVKPYYSPETGFWDGITCSRCSINPDTSRAQNGTWTGATYRHAQGAMSITIPFTGTAIYVYFILANDLGSSVTTETQSNFTLDGKAVGHFLHNPTAGTRELEYNALVHSSVGLANSNHLLTISTSGLDHDVWVGFDYALYTYFDDAVDSSSSATRPSNALTPSSASGSPQNVPTGIEGSNPNNNSGTTLSGPTIVFGVVVGVISSFVAIFIHL